MRTSLGVVVLNWNNATDTLECLRSLRSSTVELIIVAVDNASTDGSYRAIQESGLADVVLQSGANRGYAGGNNVGLQYCLAHRFEHIVVLNNDTTVQADTMQQLTERLMRDDGPLALSPRIEYLEPTGALWFGGGALDRGTPVHLPAERLPHAPDGIRPSPFLTGCCIAASRSTWSTVGEFDEGYFLIFEDSDWCRRAEQSGVRMAVVDEAVLVHKVSRSFAAVGPNRLGAYYHARNGIRYHQRWSPRTKADFLRYWVLRPTREDLRHGQVLRILLRLGGCVAGFTGSSGTAPSWVGRLAHARLRTRTSRPAERSADTTPGPITR